jgi:hypothetical protein
VRVLDLKVDMLISRRVKPREKDLDYAEEVRGSSQIPVASMTSGVLSQQLTQDAFRQPIHGVSEFRTPISRSSLRIPDVTRCQFPSVESNRELRTQLNQMWVEKLDITDGLQVALDNGDEREYRALEVKYSDINGLMYALIQSNGQANGSPSPPKPTHSQGKSGPSPASRTRPWNNQELSFSIYLQTQDITVPWTVWSHMPVSLLVPAAVSVLAMCGKIVESHHISLLFANEVMDNAYGRLSDYDIKNGDTVLIEVTMTGGGFLLPDPDRSPQRPGPDTKPRRTGDSTRGYDHTPRVEPHAGENSAAGGSGMDNRAYEKLKQTFKCPKFSGQPKDWKQWNKGFQRYLSIWELNHVLHPDFFDNLPLSTAKIRDNKLVYYIIEDATQSSPTGIILCSTSS